MKHWILITLFMLLMVGCSLNPESGTQQKQDAETVQQSEASGGAFTSFEGTLDHVHGIGYVNPETLVFASHTGLKVYKDGQWLRTVHHQNDYMGFTVVENGFFTSGHPSAGSELPNPIGLQRGSIENQGLKPIGFVGETDFHALGVGYNNQAIYLYNPAANSELEVGFYRSLDQGETWGKLQAENVSTEIFQIAVHPENEDIVAVSTVEGIFLSQDGGQSFAKISEAGQGSGVYFSEERLYYGFYNGESSLFTYDWEKEVTEEIPLPDLGQDAVMYVTKHPEHSDEVTIYTLNNSAFVMSEGDWKQILEQGQTK